MDSPEIAKDSDKSEDDETKKGRSKTVGDTEGSATSPVKVHVPTILILRRRHNVLVAGRDASVKRCSISLFCFVFYLKKFKDREQYGYT